MKKFFTLVIALSLSLSALTEVRAAIPYDSPGYVPYPSFGYWRLDEEGKKFGSFFMQTPYQPATQPVLGNPLYQNGESIPGLEEPLDLSIDEEDFIYVVDIKQNRAVKIDEKGELLCEYGDADGEGKLNAPEGIYAAPNGEVIIADTANQRLAIFDNEGTYLRQILKPDDVRVTDILWLPERVTIDSRGFYMVLLKGINSGLAVLTPNGDFSTFFGSNLSELSIWKKLQARFYSETQRRATQEVPNVIRDVFIDTEGYIYTATSQATNMQIKKFNVGSENQFKDKQMDVNPIDSYQEGYIAGMRTSYRSVCADGDGNVYAVDSGTGRIFMFDRFGEPVFSFGERMWDRNSLVVGTLGEPSSIRINSRGVLFVADRLFKGISVYTPTTYAEKLKEINYLYNDGRYADAVPLAEEILRENVYFDKANIVLGMADYQERKWVSSMEYFKKAHNTTEYSEAFWEYRLVVIQQYFGWGVLVILLAAFGLTARNIIRAKKRRGREDASL
jgi:sugar lactone lactonase YvrE